MKGQEILILQEDTPLQLRNNPYLVKRTQQDGEKDLEALVQTEQKEVAFFFMPEKSLWYYPVQRKKSILEECESIRLTFRTYLNIDEYYLEGDVIPYHTHQKEFSKKAMNFFGNPLPKLRYIFKPRKFKYQVGMELYHSAAFFPSAADLIAQSSMKIQFNKLKSFSAKIISPRGITNFDVRGVITGEYGFFHNKILERLAKMKLRITETEEGDKIEFPIEELFEEANKLFEDELKMSFERRSALFYRK